MDSILEGWYVTQSWESQTTARNHMLLAAAPLIDLKPYVDMVVVHHSVRPQLSTFYGNIKPGNVQERPMVSLRVFSTHKANQPVEFHDDYPGGPDMQWTLNIIKVDKTIQTTSMSIRFHVCRDILPTTTRTEWYKTWGQARH